MKIFYLKSISSSEEEYKTETKQVPNEMSHLIRSSQEQGVIDVVVL